MIEKTYGRKGRSRTEVHRVTQENVLRGQFRMCRLLQDQSGIALLLTLWVLAALVVMAAGLSVTARTEAQISRNFASMVRCRWAARAGENCGIAELEKLASEPQTYLGEGSLRISSEEENIDLDEASFEVVIHDEAGKININTAPASVLRKLFGREIADCIIDWRDRDEQPRPLGAETHYYASLPTPYRCKNGPFDTVQELLLVKGITEEMLSMPVTSGGTPVSELLTVYSRDLDLTIDGQERIDIQDATREQLKTRLGDVLRDRDIDEIINYRQRHRFHTPADIVDVPSISRRKIRQIYDRLTVVRERRKSSGGGRPSGGTSGGPSGRLLPGRINLNTAPAEVLAALPGIDEGTAFEIVNYRKSRGPFKDVGQLLSVTGVSERAFSRAAPLLTVRSRVFRIESIGRLAKERASRSIVCVADAVESNKAKIRYWRE